MVRARLKEYARRIPCPAEYLGILRKIRSGGEGDSKSRGDMLERSDIYAEG